MNKRTADFVVIGGGIVGLATAMRLLRRDQTLNVTVVEAEADVAAHQSGRNSGVLHSGIYYTPGSNKAITCRQGKALMETFCEQHQIPFDRCGKVLIATRESELPMLERLAERAMRNGVSHARINTDQLREMEPYAAGIAAIHVPETGIVSYAAVCQAMKREIQAAGGQVLLNQKVEKITVLSRSLSLLFASGENIEAARFVNCAGLQSDRVLRMAGGKSPIQIVPFRGEYYELLSDRRSLCRNLIYPVPDPSLPFLGVHFTRMIDGSVECGPNAVLALARNAYDWRSFNARDLIETFGFGGFQRLALKHWRTGVGEIHRSLNKSAFVRALQKLVPSVRAEDLRPSRAGVRAQAVAPDGRLVDDFLIEETENAIHVLNAPSPAATASIAIADQIIEQAMRKQ